MSHSSQIRPHGGSRPQRHRPCADPVLDPVRRWRGDCVFQDDERLSVRTWSTHRHTYIHREDIEAATVVVVIEKTTRCIHPQPADACVSPYRYSSIRPSIYHTSIHPFHPSIRMPLMLACARTHFYQQSLPIFFTLYATNQPANQPTNQSTLESALPFRPPSTNKKR